MPLKMFAPLKEKNVNARAAAFLIINRLKFAIWEAFAAAVLSVYGNNSKIDSRAVCGPAIGIHAPVLDVFHGVCMCWADITRLARPN